jgi:hypothetical protein
VSKLLWRVKLVAERQPGVTTDIEFAGIERDAQAGLADLGVCKPVGGDHAAAAAAF